MKHKAHQLKQFDILKKINECEVKSQTEFKKIIANLTQQKIRLANDLQQLQKKVSQLQQAQKRKISQVKKAKLTPQNTYAKVKRELQEKYSQFNRLRKKLAKGIISQPISINLKQYVNQCCMIQDQIKQLVIQLKDVKQQNKKLLTSIKINFKEGRLNMKSMDIIQEQNKDLKRNLYELRKINDEHDNKSVKAQIMLYNKKSRLMENNQRVTTLAELKQSRLTHKTQIIHEMFPSSRNGPRKMITEIQENNNLYPKAISHRRQPSLEKEIEQASNINKLLLNNLRGLQSVKMRHLEELKRLSLASEVKNKKNYSTQTEHQTKWQDINIQPLLRIDFYGLDGTDNFNDRLILQSDRHTSITGFYFYENKCGFSAIKAQYSNGMLSKLPIPCNYLSEKCQSQHMRLSVGDCVSGITIKYNKKTKTIVGLRIVTNEKKIQFLQKGQIGFEETTRNHLLYKMDINQIQQWPVCIFGSFLRKGEDWFMSSLGVEINI